MSVPSLSPDTHGSFQRERLSGMLAMDHLYVFWRHDVDFRLDCAVEMAAFERNHKVSRSTYYLRSDGVEYQLSSQDGQDAMTVITECDHMLGLHVDLGLPRDAVVTEGQIRQAYEEQYELIPNNWKPLFGGGRFSLHAPPSSALFMKVFGLRNAMDPYYKDKYVSDSRGVFSWGDPEPHLTRRTPVQINLHPEWWFLPEDEAAALRVQEAAKP